MRLTAEALGEAVASKVMTIARQVKIDSNMRPVSRCRFPLIPMRGVIRGPISVTATNIPYCWLDVGTHCGMFTRMAATRRVAVHKHRRPAENKT